MNKVHLSTSVEIIRFHLWREVTLNGNIVQSVKRWPHLGHIIACNGDDGDDIDKWRYKLICQINDVICTFHRLDSTVKINLLKSYYLSLYGCGIWHLQHRGVENICLSWRTGLRRTWGLPRNCRPVVVDIFSATISLWHDMQTFLAVC